jgi:5'-methylthioadenosine/S-adenosylhomocysteine nucleosidase
MPILGFKHWLLIAAMDEEEEAILGALAPRPASQVILGRHHQAKRFDLGARGVLTLLRSGVGVANAALATALACEKENPDGVLLLGVGGALSPDLEIGDLVVATQVFQHDSFSSLDAGDFHMRSGEYILRPEQADPERPLLASHPALAEWFRHEFPGAKLGTLLSGNEFVGRSERKRKLAGSAKDALLVDMEAAGVAMVAHRYGVPFGVAKTVSDRLTPEGSIESDFSCCLRSSAAHAAQVAARIAT